MARLTRVTAIAFGANGTTDDFETFGSTAGGGADFSKDPAAIQATDDWLLGWRPALITAKAPVLQDMNGKMLVDSYQLCYLFQDGLPEYDSSTTYFKGGLVKNLANTGYVEFYLSIIDNNTGNALPTRVDNSNWSFLFAIQQSTGLMIHGKSVAFASTSTQGIVGTTTNDSAASGMVGEEVRSYVGGTNAAANGNWDDGTSISLTAGDWDVTAILNPESNGATWTEVDLGIGLFSGNNGSGLTDGDNQVRWAFASTSTVIQDFTLTIPTYRMSFSSTTTVYLKRRFVYSAGTPHSTGCRLSARRVR